MRDERFDWAENQDSQNERDARAEAHLTSFGDLAPLEQALQQWWLRESSLPHEGEPEEFLPAAGERLSHVGIGLDARFKPLVNSLVPALADSHDDSLENRAAQMLIGRSIGVATATGPSDVALFDQALRFLRRNWIALDTFLKTFIRTVPAPMKEEWTRHLRVIPEDPSALMEVPSYREPIPTERLLEAERHAREGGLSAYLWDWQEQSYRPRDSWIHRGRVLLAFDPGVFASTLESYPLRELREDLLFFLRFSEDPQAILGLLRVAPPVFAEDGWTGNVAALRALEAASHYADQLHAAVETGARNLWGRNAARRERAEKMLQQLEHTELPRWMEEVFDAVSQRADGRRLMLFYGTHLAGTHLRPDSRARNTWSSGDLALRAIRSRLRPAAVARELEALLSVDHPQGETARDEALYLSTAALLTEDPRGTWDWYVARLEARDKGLCSHLRLDVPEWVYTSLGSVLLELRDPLTKWREAWRRLFIPDRERTRFARFDIDAWLPSLHLIFVGLGLLRCANRAERCPAPQAAALWRELRRAILIFTQGSVHPLKRAPRAFAAEGFDLAPAIFGADWPALLDEYRAWMVADPERQVYVAAALMSGGVSREEVLAQMTQRGCDPLAAIKSLEHRLDRDDSWAQARERLLSPSGA